MGDELPAQICTHAIYIYASMQVSEVRDDFKEKTHVVWRNDD